MGRLLLLARVVETEFFTSFELCAATFIRVCPLLIVPANNG